MLERGKRDQYSPIGKGGHPPLQALLGPGCRCANTRSHFTQFLPSLFGGGIDVLGDAFGSRFLGGHDFIFQVKTCGGDRARRTVDLDGWPAAVELLPISSTRTSSPVLRDPF